MVDDRVSSLFVLALVVVAFGAIAATVDVGTLPDGNDPEIEPPVPESPGEDSDGTVFESVEGMPVVGSVTAWASGGLSLLPWVVVTSLSTPALVAILLLGLAGGLTFLFVVSESRGSLGADESAVEDAVDLGKIGRAAGDAADRIDARTDVTNEVYRAWDEMTRHLSVSNPEATTPDEFEVAAIEAGMAREDVAELTRLFEEVRYGERGLEGREEQAVAALRRIEATYAAGDDDGGTGDERRTGDDGGTSDDDDTGSDDRTDGVGGEEGR